MSIVFLLSLLSCLLSLVSLSFPHLSLAATLPAKPQPKGYKGDIFHLNVIDVFDQAIGKARVCAYPWNIDLSFLSIGINSQFKLPYQESDQACYQARPPLKAANGDVWGAWLVGGFTGPC